MKRSRLTTLILILSIYLASIGYAETATAAPVLPPQATAVSAVHLNGQTFVTWQESEPMIPAEVPSGKEFNGLKAAQAYRISYRIYSAPHPITTTADLTPVATVPALSGWNQTAYGIETLSSDRPMHRFVIPGSDTELPNGTGLWVHNPDNAGAAYYAVTAVADSLENTTLSSENALVFPVSETVGPGKPILQRTERPESFMGVAGPNLYYYTRWEAPPNCSIEGKAFNYLVGIPPTVADPAPVGIHMHCWGGSQESGYTWWNDAADGAILLASNEDPYDWWTGYHERLLTPWIPRTVADWQNGVVHPYASNRLFSFLDWLRLESAWQVDPYRTFLAGSSMGGSGSMMTGIRNGGKVAWVRSNVGVHVPGETTTMKNAYAAIYGQPEYGVRFENGTPVWNYYDDVWFLRNNIAVNTPFLTFSNAKNDPLIDWPQAVHLYQALQDTKRPHLFVWGQEGHSQQALMPGNGGHQTMPIDIRVNQSLPAFTHCSLDDNPGNGDAADGASQGQINGYLYWLTEDLTDTAESWEISVGLTDAAPQAVCTVDITARRLQNFNVRMGWPVNWENRDLKTGVLLASGTIHADSNGLLTIPQITVGKTMNRIILKAR